MSCSLMLAFLFRLDYTCTCASKKQAWRLRSQGFGPVLWFEEPRHGALRPYFLAGIHTAIGAGGLGSCPGTLRKSPLPRSDRHLRQDLGSLPRHREDAP